MLVTSIPPLVFVSLPTKKAFIPHIPSCFNQAFYKMATVID
jgi:hypothetical protein